MLTNSGSTIGPHTFIVDLSLGWIDSTQENWAWSVGPKIDVHVWILGSAELRAITLMVSGFYMITYESSTTREYLLLSWDKEDLEYQVSKGGYGVRNLNLTRN